MAQGAPTNRSELGQAMVEFALVLPALALLTFGTLEVALLVQQQSALNAAAFMGARELSVLGNKQGTGPSSIAQFARTDGWLRHAQAQSAARGTLSTFHVQVHTDGLVGLLGLFASRQASLHALAASASMPLEYDAHAIKSSYSPTSKPKTFWLLDYGSNVAILNKLQPFVQPVQKAIGMANQVLQKIPNVTLQLPVDGEPFTTRYAVVSNPHQLDHKGRQDSGNGFTKDYFAADYEKLPPKPHLDYKVSTITGGLKSYEGTLGKLKAQLPTIKTAAATAAATDPTVKTALDALKLAGQGLAQAGTFADTLATYDKGLFR